MLQMRIVKAPLRQAEYETILGEYNRLTLANIPMNEFVRWVAEGPAGPAWHALLQTDEGRIVGHTSVLPIPAQFQRGQMIAAMSEYSFLHEDFRKIKIHGYESLSKPTFIILLDHLFQHCLKEGWGPLFASTNERNQVFTRKVGLRPAEFPLRECLLVLQPSNAARHTPNLSKKQRAALFTTGLAQKSLWSVARHFARGKNGVHEVPMGSQSFWPLPDRLSFYEAKESAEWRYLRDQYVRYAVGYDSHDYIIAKRGKHDRYMRVCQYHLGSVESINSVMRALLQKAREDRAMGIRWAVYESERISEELVSRLRWHGFLCANRVRTVMVHKNFPEYLQSAIWNMSDAHFCFDP
jgi:hypothetical protein